VNSPRGGEPQVRELPKTPRDKEAGSGIQAARVIGTRKKAVWRS